jgi:hypothetical protein
MESGALEGGPAEELERAVEVPHLDAECETHEPVPQVGVEPPMARIAPGPPVAGDEVGAVDQREELRVSTAARRPLRAAHR